MLTLTLLVSVEYLILYIAIDGATGINGVFINTV